MALVKLIGGPLDGKEIEDTFTTTLVNFPRINSGARWFAENEPIPMEIDPLSGRPRMQRLQTELLRYRRAADGHLHYERTEV